MGEVESFYLNAAMQFFHMVLRDHTYITGGNSENERFRTPGKLDSTRNNINNESCNSYNMLKLARELFKVTGDIQYADYYENAYINEIISGINPETGMTTYFKPMGTGYFKLFGTETNSFWCCTGSGMENYTKLNDSLYFNNGNDLYVNMYVSSELKWAEKSFSLTQSANIPLSGNVVFTVGMAPVSAINIKFRAPYWIAAGQNVSIIINNIAFYPVKKNGYLEVNRVFRAGDKIELDFPMEVKAERLPDNPNAVAFKYGPVVLSAGFGTEKMVSAGHMASAKATIPQGVLIKDYILIKEKSVDAWIANIKSNLVQKPGKLEFTLKNTDEDNRLKFTPHYRRYTDRYGIYFILSAIDSPEFQESIKSSKNAAKKLEATIDEIQITNDQHELVHNLQGNSSGGYVERGVDYGDIKITPEQNNALIYVNNILIDDAAVRRLVLTSETEILNIKVVAEDGTTKAYTLTITKAFRDQ